MAYRNKNILYLRYLKILYLLSVKEEIRLNAMNMRLQIHDKLNYMNNYI